MNSSSYPTYSCVIERSYPHHSEFVNDLEEFQVHIHIRYLPSYCSKCGGVEGQKTQSFSEISEMEVGLLCMIFSVIMSFR